MNAYKFEYRNSLFTVVTDKDISHVYVIEQHGVKTASYSSNGHPSEAHAYKAMKDALRRLDQKSIAAMGQVVAVQKEA